MCLENNNHVQLGWCPHGAFHLRVANTTLHLTREQVLALHTELNRCVHAEPTHAPSPHQPDAWRHNRFGQSSN